MALIDHSKLLLYLDVLQDPDADKSLQSLLQIAGIDELNDQVIHDRLEGVIGDALIHKDSEIELEIEVAIAALVILKRGVRRPRGGQVKTRYERLQKKTLVAIAKQIKQELIVDGESATQAHDAAAEKAAEIGLERGIEYKPSTISRAMDDQP